MILEAIVSGIVLIGGLGYGFYSHFHKENPKIYKNLNHCDVPIEWKQIRYNAWVKASNILSMNGIKAVTKCKKIIIEKGIKINPKTGQWGRPTMLNGKEFWYAGLGSTTWIKIVATPEGKPYIRSEPILAHEVGETILNLDPVWSKKTIDERNKFLWGLGL